MTLHLVAIQILWYSLKGEALHYSLYSELRPRGKIFDRKFLSWHYVDYTIVGLPLKTRLTFDQLSQI